MNKNLAYRTIAYLKTHYTTNDETIINKEEIEAIDFILDELVQLTNNWNELEEFVKNKMLYAFKNEFGYYKEVLDKMKKIKEKNK